MVVCHKKNLLIYCPERSCFVGIRKKSAHIKAWQRLIFRL